VGGFPEPPGAPSQRPKAFTVGFAAGQWLQAKLTEDDVFANIGTLPPVLAEDVCIVVDSMKVLVTANPGLFVLPEKKLAFFSVPLHKFCKH
tara:strand:+ start:1372 stop:1644 length:273 start_codon:yes stop_codon:yes gene_type:complete